MSNPSDDMRAEYRLEELGSGVRGKYFERVAKGSNLVLLSDEVFKAFPNSEAVNEALLGLLALTDQMARITGRANSDANQQALL